MAEQPADIQGPQGRADGSRVLTPEELNRRAEEYAPQAQQKEILGQAREFINFRVGNEQYVIEMDFIGETTAPGPVARFPRATELTPGLVNRRGEIILLMDLGFFMSGTITQRDQRSKVIFIETSDHVSGILVDDVFETIELDTGKMQKSLSSGKAGEEYFKGLFNLEGQTLLWLDIERIMAEVGRRLSR